MRTTFKLRHILLFQIILVLSSCQQKTQSSSDVVLDRPDIEQRIIDLGIELPVISPPIANYVNVTRSGNTLYLAGKGPKSDNGEYITGKLGKELTEQQGYNAARQVGIMQLAVLKNYLGDMNRVKQILKVQGMVNAAPDYTNHPEVINGYSDLMVEVFGESGKHARAAVGMASLPRNICVEIDMIVEIYE